MKAQGYWWHRQYPSIRKKINTFEIPRIWAPLSIYSLGSKVKTYYKSWSVLVALPIPLRYKPNNVKDWLIWDLEYDYWKLWKILRCSSKIWHVYIHNILTHLMFYNILFINIKFKEISIVYYLCLEFLKFIFCYGFFRIGYFEGPETCEISMKDYEEKHYHAHLGWMYLLYIWIFLICIDLLLFYNF